MENSVTIVYTHSTLKYDCEICEFWLIWNVTFISWWIRLVISHMTNLWLVRAFGILCQSVVVLEHEGNIILWRACSWTTDGTTTTGTTNAASARQSHNATGAARQRANQEVRTVVVQQHAVGYLTTRKNTHNNRIQYTQHYKITQSPNCIRQWTSHCYWGEDFIGHKWNVPTMAHFLGKKRVKIFELVFYSPKNTSSGHAEEYKRKIH